MKKLVAILALTAAVLPSAAFTANAAYAAQRAHARVQAAETYTLDGKVVSQDPDPFIRQQSLREAESGGADR